MNAQEAEFVSHPAEVIPAVGRSRLRGLHWLIAIAALIVLGRAVDDFLTERWVFGPARTFDERQARLHDVGGALLIAVQVPFSAAVAGLAFLHLRRVAAPRSLRQFWAAPPRPWLLGAVGVALLLDGWWFSAVLGGGAAVEDDHTYLFQAALLSQGRVSLPVPFEGFSRAFHWAWTIAQHDRLASFQMPGHCALLAIGVLLSCPWAVPVAMGAITVIATHHAARGFFGRRTARLAALLLLTSPYFHTMQTSFSAATSGAMAVALTVLAGQRLLRSARATWAIAFGLAVALLWSVRPPTALFCAAPIGVLLARAVLRQRIPVRRLVTVAAAFAVGVLPYLLYCRAVTGDWALSPGAVYSRRLFSPEMSLWNVLSSQGHDVFTSVPNVVASVVRLNTYMFGWPFSLAPIGLLLWRRRWQGATGWLLCTCAALMVFYCLSEKLLGWYFYELMPCFAILGARGIVEARRSAVERRARPRVRAGRATADRVTTLALACCAASVAISLPATLARQARFVDVWMTPIRWIERQIDETPAVVFIDAAHIPAATRRALLGSNDVDLSRPVIFAQSNGDAQLEARVRAMFPSRAAFTYRSVRLGQHLERLPRQ